MRFAMCGAALLGFALAASADDVPSIKLVLQPTPEARPALKYQFLPPEDELTPGNAALGYYRAMSPEWHKTLFDPEKSKQMEPWDATPARQLPVAEVRKLIDSMRWPLQELELAARRKNCDWQLDDRIETDGIGLLLPELQGMRTVARILRLKAKLEIAEGKFDAAVRTIQTGYAMGRHIGEGPTLIHSLVGMAISATFSMAVEDFIDAPGSPSVYWALTTLPRPLIDLRKPMGGELRMITSVFPPLNRIDGRVLSSDEANHLLNESMERMRPAMEQGQGFPNRAAMWAFITLAYPQAKKSLVERGRKADEVDAMPMSQVVLLVGSLEYRESFDEMLKWMSVPFPEARVKLKEADANLKKLREANKTSIGTQLVSLLAPAMEKVYSARIRTDRKIAALRTVEAIRLHLAGNKGKLPDDLEAITAAPVPDDPATGKPFRYVREGNKATLTGPEPADEKPTTTNRIVYELFVME